MKDVKLEFKYTKVEIEDGWLCVYDGENQILIRPENFKKILAAINYTHCCETLNEDNYEHVLTFKDGKIISDKFIKIE
tara:strand:+ start:1602 stop:1835 length:234 start_codon:yes stop_codon:yes gene_type:complete